MSPNNELEVVATELIKVSLNGDSAARLLIGNLVNFLADKGVIDRDEYLDYVKETKKLLDEGGALDDESQMDMIKNIFDLHLNDFKKPE